jgi:hypothetical protein
VRVRAVERDRRNLTVSRKQQLGELGHRCSSSLTVVATRLLRATPSS